MSRRDPSSTTPTELETLYPGRSVIPPDPALAFVDALLEDYADEWLTKAMFHYRWAFAADVANAAAILPRWFRTNQPESDAVANGKMFAERQIGRLAVVGSNEITAPVIEESYRRLLRLLDAHLIHSRFVLGDRPASSDLGLFGQLTQLVGFDPTSAAIAHQQAPRVVAWVEVAEDLSGLEPEERDWTPRDDGHAGFTISASCAASTAFSSLTLSGFFAHRKTSIGSNSCTEFTARGSSAPARRPNVGIFSVWG